MTSNRPFTAALAATALLIAGVAVLRDRSGETPVTSSLASGAVSTAQSSDGGYLDTAGRYLAAVGDGIPTGRPSYTATHPDENRHAPAPRTVSPAWVSGIVLDAPVYLADTALPWRYRLSEDVVAAVDEGTIHAGIAAWNGVSGSRWASAFQGYTTINTAVADGQSIVFLEESCDGLINANAYLFTDGGLGITRYGASGSQIVEADIGVCPRATAAPDLRRALRHEVGHVVGLGHQCGQADDCWQTAMGAGDLTCRTMYWQARSCQERVSGGDVLALRTLYPQLRPLHGSGREQTTARASFAMFPDRQADTVVLLSASAPSAVAPSAAALASLTGGTYLLGEPDAEHCITGIARAEVNRALAHRGKLILVGDWPIGACEDLTFDWNLTTRIVRPQAPEHMALEMADLAQSGQAIVVTGVGANGTGVSGDAVPAAAYGGSHDAPVLLASPDGLGPDSLRWVSDNLITQATIVGGTAVVPEIVQAQLDARGVSVTRLAGDGRVATALAVAQATSASDARQIVIASYGSSSDGLAAAVAATRSGGVLLLTPPTVDPQVLDFITSRAPATGWTVGGPAVLPLDVLAMYSGAAAGG